MATKAKPKKTQAKKGKSKVDVGYEEISLDKIPQTKPPGAKEFEALPGSFPDVWLPEKPGETRTGMFIAAKSVDFSTTKTEDYRRIGTFQDPEGERFSVWDSAATRTLFDHAKILLGSWVRIIFKGEKKIKGKKQPMKDLEVSLDKAGSDLLKKALQDAPI